MKKALILTLVILFALTTLCACDPGIVVTPTNGSSSSSQSTASSAVTSQTDAPSVGTLDDYVKTAKQATQSFGDGNTTTYRLPEILLDSTDAKAANDEIMNRFGDMCKNYGEYSPVISLDYEAYLNDKYLSVLVTDKVDGGNSYGLCYVFDVTTGDQLNNETLCSMTGRDYNAAIATLTDNLTTDYNASYSGLPGNDDYRTKTLSSSNISDAPMYLDGSGSLKALVNIYAAVGGGNWVKSYAAE